jgi:shikimate dehydrogenase
VSISGRTALYGVMGHPVGHSLSPAMHNAAYAALGIDAVYVPLPVTPEALHDAVRGAHALGFLGVNVTVPHKQRAAGMCVALDRVAEEIGAVNTLRRVAEGYEGYNTDAPACLALLEAAGVAEGARALVLGAGGAARAAAWALMRLGGRVKVASRRLETAAELCQLMLATSPEEGVRMQPAPWADIAAEARAADVVVNATPLGLSGRDALPPLGLGRGQVAVDFVYGATAFAGAARAGGATLVSGEDLLVRQGALAFTLWLGRAAPEAVMTEAVAKARGGAAR